MANAKYPALRAPIKAAFATCTISAFILAAVRGCGFRPIVCLSAIKNKVLTKSWNWHKVVCVILNKTVKLKNILLFFFFFLNFTFYGQQLDWARQGVGNRPDYAQSVTTDLSGNVYVTGFFKSDSIKFGNIILPNVGGDDIYLVKYDPAGNVLWAKSAGGVNGDFSNSVATDAYGNVYITGTFCCSSITFDSITLTGVGAIDIFITKYDSIGNILWAKSAGGNYHDGAKSLTVDIYCNVYITGNSGSSGMMFDSVSTTGAGLFIVKYDCNGNAIWVRNTVGSNHCGNGIVTDASGNIYVTGFFDGNAVFGSTTLISTGFIDVFIVKYDQNGNTLWAKNADGSKTEYSYGIALDPNGFIYITGSFYSDSIKFDSIILTDVDFSDPDMFLAKYDVNGNVIWAKSAGGNSYDYGYGLAVDVNGDVYVTGTFNSSSFTIDSYILTKTTISYYSDIFIVKLNSSGNVLFATNPVVNLEGYCHSVTTDAYGNAYIAGHFYGSSIIFGNDTLFATGIYPGIDIFLAKYKSDVTGVFTQTKPQSLIAVYPNPSSGIFTVNLHNFRDSKICVYDLLGNCLLNKSCQNDLSPTIDLNTQSKGIYFMEIVSDGERLVKKIVLQ